MKNKTMLPAFVVTETLYEGHGTTVLRGIRTADHRPVILKVLDPKRSRQRDSERLKHELTLARTLDLPSVVAPLALDTYGGMPALVLEDFGGQSLDHFLGTPMHLERFLDLAVAISSAVADIHARGIIHKDLKPRNILLCPSTGEVKLVDFGLASQSPREHTEPKSSSLIEGSLPYLSPEQTGRMNRAIDSRADLYALGVTYYEMLTGRLPFDAHDPLEWVHCHIARAPPPPSKLVPGLPEVLSTIVLKLLAKTPEDRYQTARGLRRDLERCREEWHSKGRIEPFRLAQHDVSGRLQIPQKLYGRELEITALLSAFERVVHATVPELVLVAGYPGIGKSALVHELHKPVVRNRGFFISGKFDQYKRDIPYSTFVQAFRDLVLEILAESEERIASFRERLQRALSINAQLIVDVIPQVELVMGRQMPVVELPPTEAQNRFRIVFQQFIGVFAQKEHPLVLFLDDLQWADLASLRLLEDLITQPDVHHLIVIGAYRDIDVNPSHPLMLMLDKARKKDARISTIALGPLTREHLVSLVSDTFHCGREDASPLSDLIHEKTAGNPFFSLQFLTALHDEHLIEFDGIAEAWKWDVDKIRAKGFTDNVVEFMVELLTRLPASTQEALEQLACLGNSADAPVVALVHGSSEDESHTVLEGAIRAGLILHIDNSYKFLHDRVQEAAYSIIPESTRAAAHLRIGRLLVSRTTPAELEEKIFEIVNQLNRGLALITAREEREHVAELNFLAGKRAKASTAYASALNYFAMGSALLPEDRWERRYELSFPLELYRAECEYLTGKMDAAEARLAELSHLARNLVDGAAVTCVRVALYTTLDRSDRAVEVSLEYLRRVGVEWSAHPSSEEVREEYARLWRKLGSGSIEKLIDLPTMTDPEHRAIMDVLTWVRPSALFTDEKLTSLIVGRMANLSLEHGNSDTSCLAYVWLGMLLGPHFGAWHEGFRFGKLGFDLSEKFSQFRLKARVYLDFGHLVTPWTKHVRSGIGYLQRAFDVAQTTGDMTYASFACNCSITLMLAAGDPLDEVHRVAEKALEFVRRAKFGLIVDIVTTQLGFIRALRGHTPDLASFNDARFDEREFERHLVADPHLAIATCWHWIRKLQLKVLANDYRGAIEAASKAEPLLWTSPSFFEVAEYHFYGALAHAAHLDAASADERSHHLAALVAHHAKLAVWAENCSENFDNRAALVAAEIARIDGRHLDAESLYEKAIRSARDNGFIQNEALAYELASRFYRARGFEQFADTYLRNARNDYARWGADGKVEQIDRQHPYLVEPSLLAPTTTFAVRPEQLDLASVIKASQTISSEIIFDQLVRTLLKVVLEQGGAERAGLILCQGESASIEAEAILDENGVATSILGGLSVDSAGKIPASIVHYVQRTKESVILSDGSTDANKFSGDEYFAQRTIKSVLCMPILRQSEVVGMLYLENNLLTGAFTPERLMALSLLATQAAISLEKAQLLGKEQAARAAAEAAERRAAFLAETGALLSESLDYEQTLERLGQLCVRSLCDWCVIDIIDGEEIRRILAAHKDPIMLPLVEEFRRRCPPGVDSPHPSSRVMRTGQPLLFSELSDEVMRTLVMSDEHLRKAHELGARSSMIVPLVARGQTLGALSIVSSSPERHYTNADLCLAQEIARRAAIAIDNARLHRKTQEALRARDEFLALASHELNTPVAALTLALQSMARSLESKSAIDAQSMRRMIEQSLRQGNRLGRLNRALLDMSQIHAGQLPLDLDDVDIVALTRNVIEQFKVDLERAGCSISFKAEGRIVGHWDRVRIEQVIQNLLSNAIKFGSGHPIRISVGVEAQTAWIAVTDRGIGIAPERQGRIFERLERAASTNYGGLGLGLYISSCIAQAHGGAIRVQSELGSGATFILELPRPAPAIAT